MSLEMTQREDQVPKTKTKTKQMIPRKHTQQSKTKSLDLETFNIKETNTSNN
jgi:hypothetical protein